MSKNQQVDVFLSLNVFTCAAYAKMRANLRRNKTISATEYWLKVCAIDAAFDKRCLQNSHNAFRGV